MSKCSGEEAGQVLNEINFSSLVLMKQLFPKFLGIMYAKTMISIRAVAKKLNDHGGHSTQKHRGRRDIFIYLRMFSVLSFNWIFGILTWIIPDPDPCDQDKGDFLKKAIFFQLQKIAPK